METLGATQVDVVKLRSDAARANLIHITDRLTNDQLLADHRLIRQITWAREGGLVYSPTGRCLHWLTRGRCGVAHCGQERSKFGWAWLDHVSGWRWEGGNPAALIAQPYQVSYDSLEALVTLGRRWNVTVTISGRGWHGLGTTFVEVRPVSFEPVPKWFKSFVDACCVLESGARVAAGDLRNAYIAWSESAGFDPRVSPRKFGMEVLSLPGVTPARSGDRRFYSGIRLREP